VCEKEEDVTYRHQPQPARGDAAVRALNRVFVRAYYSYASYLQGAAPWQGRGNNALREIIERIAAEHRQLAVGVAELILDRRARLLQGQYPMHFTSSNYLALTHLAGCLIDEQQGLIREMQDALAHLPQDDEAGPLIAAAIASQKRDTAALVAALELKRVIETVAEQADNRQVAATVRPADAAISQSAGTAQTAA
jgi:hypothetical protein